MAGGIESKWREGTRQSASDILHAGSRPSSPRALQAVAQYVQANRVPEYKSPVAQALFGKRFPQVKAESITNQPGGGWAIPGSQSFNVPATPETRPYAISPKMGYYAVANHEAEHAYHQTPKTVNEEIGPSVGDLVFMGEQFAREQGKPLQHRVQLPGGVSHDINWMREQAAKHGYWDGRSMDSLLATPEGKQWLARMDQPADAPFSPSGVYPQYINTKPGPSPTPQVSTVPNEKQPQLSTLQMYNLAGAAGPGQAIMSKQQRQTEIGNYTPSPIARTSPSIAPSLPSVPSAYPTDTSSETTLAAQPVSEGKKDMGISQLYPSNGDVRRMSNPAAGRDNRFIPQNQYATQQASDAQVYPRTVARGPSPNVRPYTPQQGTQEAVDQFLGFAAPPRPQPQGNVRPYVPQEGMREAVNQYLAPQPAAPSPVVQAAPQIPPDIGPPTRAAWTPTAAERQAHAMNEVTARNNPEALRRDVMSGNYGNTPEVQAQLQQAAQARYLLEQGPSMQNQTRRVGTEADRMAEARAASEARVANPSTVPYGARNVVSPLQGDAAHFQGMADREAAKNAADTQQYSDNIKRWSGQQKADANGNGIPDRDEAVSTKFGSVGIHNINQLQDVNAKYNTYMSGYRSDKNAMATSRPMSFDEFAKNEQETFKKRPVFGVDNPSNLAAGPYELAREKVQNQREQQRGIDEQRRAPRVEMAQNQGIQSQIISNALARGYNPAQANQIAANAMASRFDAGQAEATRGAALQAELMRNQAAVTQAQLRNQTELGTAGINASVAEKQNALQNALLQSGIDQKKSESAFEQQKYTDTAPTRELTLASAKREADAAAFQAQLNEERLKNPVVAANDLYGAKHREGMTIAAQQGMTPKEAADYARSYAEPQTQTELANMRALGKLPPDFTWAPPAVPGLPSVTTPGSSKGLATATDLTKLYADFKTSHENADPTPDQLAAEAAKQGFLVNPKIMDELHKNATASKYADNSMLWMANTHGYIPFLRHGLPQVGTPDPLAGAAYKAITGEDPVDPNSSWPGLRTWPHNKPEVQKRISPLLR